MDFTFVPPAIYQLGEEVEIPTGRGNVQFWLKEKGKLLLAVSQTKKQTKLVPITYNDRIIDRLWQLHFVKPNKVKKIKKKKEQT